MKSTTLKAQLHTFDRAEIILIRVGQHIFREWVTKGRSDKDLDEAMQDVWAIKKQLREEKRTLLSKMRQKANSESGKPVKARARRVRGDS